MLTLVPLCFGDGPARGACTEGVYMMGNFHFKAIHDNTNAINIVIQIWSSSDTDPLVHISMIRPTEPWFSR